MCVSLKLTAVDIEVPQRESLVGRPRNRTHASLARCIAWLRGSRQSTSRRPGKRAGRGSRSETLWASPANPCTPNTTRSHHDRRICCARGASCAWALYLRASEEARRRGDRRTGTDHLWLALLEDPSIEVVLGVSLQQARHALEVARSRSSGRPGPGVRHRRSPTADARRAEEAEDQRRRAERSPPHDSRGQESARGSGQAQPSEAPGHGPAGAGPDPSLSKLHQIRGRCCWALSA